VLLAFINPSGPTRELKQLAVFLSNIVLILVPGVKQRASCLLIGSR